VIAAPAKALLFTSTPVHLFNMIWRTASTTPAHQLPELVRSFLLPSLFRGGMDNLILANPVLWERMGQAGVTGGRAAAENIYPGGSWGSQFLRSGAAGITGGAVGWTQAKARGESDADAFNSAWKFAAIVAALPAPGVGAVVKAFGRDVPIENAASMANLIHYSMFNNALPAMKMGMFKILSSQADAARAAGRVGASDEAIATLVNNTIGGVDLMKTARSPVTQALMRYGLVASDWEEGQMRQLASLFLPGEQGNLTRTQIVKGLAPVMLGVEALNLAANGHFTWDNEPGHEYQLETTGLYDKIAQLTNDPSRRSVDDLGTPRRTYVDVMPPIRWAMELIGEGTRYLAQQQGALEQAFVPGGQAAGGRLLRAATGDLTQGQLPPQPGEKALEALQQRLGPGLSAVGALQEFARGQQFDWTGKPLEKPVPEVPSTEWTKFLTALKPMAPAFVSTLASDINMTHPERSQWGDAVVEAMGVTRTSAQKELSANLQKLDQVKRYLGLSPMAEAEREDMHQQQLLGLEADRQKFFDRATNEPNLTHAQVDALLHKNSDQHQALTRRQWIKENISDRAPEWARSGIQALAENVWRTGGGDRPADADVGDLDQLVNAYYHPPGADPRDVQGFKKAQRNVLYDTAYGNGVDPDVLEDWIKWHDQNQDLASGAKPPIPALPGVTSDQLGDAATGFLAAAEKKDAQGNLVPGELIDDVDQRAQAQRDYLKQKAQELGVPTDTLLQRINLRLSQPGQASPIERSYNRALQTFFASKDNETLPRYKNADGTPIPNVMLPEGISQWDKWDAELADANKRYAGKARYMPQYRELAAAQERGTNARDQFLIHNAANQDYERWFGFGRNMSEQQWKDYNSGKTVGYDDLKRFAAKGPPLNETIRRDQIQELYRASNMNERLHTLVWVWVNGQYRQMPLIGAYRYSRHFMLNTSGRTLEYLAARDEETPNQAPSLEEAGASTVGAEDNGP